MRQVKVSKDHTILLQKKGGQRGKGRQERGKAKDTEAVRKVWKELKTETKEEREKRENTKTQRKQGR